jgi:1,2-phenylacetyl-CoA epoxidase catalytic subunit
MDREEFKKKAMQSLNEIFARIDELDAKKDKVKANVKAEYEEKLSRLKTQKANLQQKYEKLTDASEEKWEEVKDGFNNATKSLNEGFSELLSLFK